MERYIRKIVIGNENVLYSMVIKKMKVNTGSTTMVNDDRKEIETE